MGVGAAIANVHVDVVPVGTPGQPALCEVTAALRSVLGLQATIHDVCEVPDQAYDPSAGKYRAEPFIEVAIEEGFGDKNIAVTDREITYQDREFVFGLAYLEGDGCVVSTYRLETSVETAYLTSVLDAEFSERLRTEVVHEVGHTLGLTHCTADACVMNFSPTVAAVDEKPEDPCQYCSRRVSSTHSL